MERGSVILNEVKNLRAALQYCSGRLGTPFDSVPTKNVGTPLRVCLVFFPSTANQTLAHPERKERCLRLESKDVSGQPVRSAADLRMTFGLLLESRSHALRGNGMIRWV